MIYNHRHESIETKNDRDYYQEDRLFNNENNDYHYEIPSAYDNFIRIYAIYSDKVNLGLYQAFGFKKAEKIKEELVKKLKKDIIIKRIHHDRYVSVFRYSNFRRSNKNEFFVCSLFVLCLANLKGKDNKYMI